MQVAKDRLVTVDYTMKDEQGRTLDSSHGKEPLHYVQGADEILTGVEQALEGADPGAVVNVTVHPEEGYGVRDESLVRTVSDSAFDGVGDPAVGTRFRAVYKGDEKVFTVIAREGNRVTIDGNHPLAGRTLLFQLVVKDVQSMEDRGSAGAESEPQ
jgi:FKBP-type peptidyl-prolyl cis-trans isomerase SlyD